MSVSAIEDAMQKANKCSQSVPFGSLFHLQPFEGGSSASSIPLWGCRTEYTTAQQWENCSDAIALKIVAPRNEEDAGRTVKEARWVQYLSDQYLVTNISPNFIKSYGWYTCDASTIKRLLESRLIDPKFIKVEKIARILETTTENMVVLLTEKAWLSLDERLNDAINDSLQEGTDAPLDVMLFTKSCIFQVLVTLALVQLDMPTFRHNDLHPGNILLVKQQLKSPATVGFARTKYQIPAETHMVKFWDFEFTTEASDAVSGIAGESSDVTDCPVYDHTFFLNCIDDIFAESRKTLTEQLEEAEDDEDKESWEQYLNTFDSMYSELDMFLTRALPGIRGSTDAPAAEVDDPLLELNETGGINLRLSKSGQQRWRELGIKTPAQLLTDPYFDSLVIARNVPVSSQVQRVM